MSEELYFNDELRKCLNAAGLSDCGENDAWNYWYQRVHKAHDQAVDRVTEAQRTENAKLRDLALNCYRMAKAHCTDKDCRTRCSHWPECCEHDSLQHAEPCELAVLACELGVEVSE